MGLFYTNIEVTVADSIIWDNTYTYFVHAMAPITFKNCHFDSSPGVHTGAAAVEMVECWMAGEDVSWVAECLHTRTASASSEATLFATPTATASCSRSATEVFTQNVQRWGRRRGNRILAAACGVFVMDV
jgi:hypothetical protein